MTVRSTGCRHELGFNVAGACVVCGAGQPPPEVTVTAPHMMYATCIAHCSQRYGRIITFGNLQVRLCTDHLFELQEGLDR